MHFARQLTEQRHRKLTIFVGTSEALKQYHDAILGYLQNQPKIQVLNYQESQKKALKNQPKNIVQVNSQQPISPHVHLANNVNFRHFLGREYDFLLFHGEQGFHPDAFAALTGTVKAGGGAWLFLDRLEVEQSAFLQRLIRLGTADGEVILLTHEQGKEGSKKTRIECQDYLTHTLIPWCQILSSREQDSTPASTTIALTQEQQLGVEHITKVVTGHRDRPLVITADRGRGKSTALAFAVANLLKIEHKNILITSMHQQSLSVFFAHLKQLLPDAIHEKNRVKHRTSSVRYVPIDALLQSHEACHLLMVDEAAGFPLPILRAINKQFHRLVFVSTVHGYEGAGRGFSTKFIKELSQQYPNFNQFHINQPVRWNEYDPLEQLTFTAFALNAQMPQLNETHSLTKLSFKELDASELATDDKRLSEVFSLLVFAHYQTKPSDLKMLLDDPMVSIHCALNDDTCVGVALVLKEGGVEPKLATLIKQGKRRVKGHFTPQSLLTHVGYKSAFEQQYYRVVRIAIADTLQQQQLGSQFLHYISHWASAQHGDFVSASFGANRALVSFWLKNDFKLARLGFQKDAASGEHSALVLKPLHTKAQTVVTELCGQFYQDLDYYISDEFAFLAPDLVTLLYSTSELVARTPARDTQAVVDFIDGHRQFSCCAPKLKRWLVHFLQTNTLEQDDCDINILVRKLLQQHSVEQLVQEFHLTGKKAVTQQLKQSIKRLYFSQYEQGKGT
ncbi:GNAT family N-acetyltransferase [Thalassotalea aquiviva]|uniref:GNAT family N-acetyltransferase n=1 Tax=Thalassotalea aquiviva TaxID=3242415 RepID=UPI00352B6531